MKILSVTRLEDCLDGSSVWEFAFAAAWTEADIRWLSTLGSLEYFAAFPRPFFRLLHSSGAMLRGVQGLARCRVILPRQNRDAVLQRLRQDLEPAIAAGTDKE